MRTPPRRLESNPNFENQFDSREEIAPTRPTMSSGVQGALVVAGLLAYGGFIWRAARYGRQEDAELIGLAWAPLLVTLFQYSPCAFRSIARLLHQACVTSAKWFDRSTD